MNSTRAPHFRYPGAMASWWKRGLVLVLPLVLVALPRGARACQGCNPLFSPDRPAEGLRNADAVFVGTLVASTEFSWPALHVLPHGRNDFLNAELLAVDVHTSWKGVHRRRILIRDATACDGPGWKLGSTYLIYAMDPDRSDLYAWGCGATKRFDGTAEEDLAFLSTQPQLPLRRPFPWAALGIVLALGIAVLRRRDMLCSHIEKWRKRFGFRPLAQGYPAHVDWLRRLLRLRHSPPRLRLRIRLFQPPRNSLWRLPWLILGVAFFGSVWPRLLFDTDLVPAALYRLPWIMCGLMHSGLPGFAVLMIVLPWLRAFRGQHAKAVDVAGDLVRIQSGGLGWGSLRGRSITGIRSAQAADGVSLLLACRTASPVFLEVGSQSEAAAIEGALSSDKNKAGAIVFPVSATDPGIATFLAVLEGGFRAAGCLLWLAYLRRGLSYQYPMPVHWGESTDFFHSQRSLFLLGSLWLVALVLVELLRPCVRTQLRIDPDGLRWRDRLITDFRSIQEIRVMWWGLRLRFASQRREKLLRLGLPTMSVRERQHLALHLATCAGIAEPVAKGTYPSQLGRQLGETVVAWFSRLDRLGESKPLAPYRRDSSDHLEDAELMDLAANRAAPVELRVAACRILFLRDPVTAARCVAQEADRRLARALRSALVRDVDASSARFERLVPIFRIGSSSFRREPIASGNTAASAPPPP